MQTPKESYWFVKYVQVIHTHVNIYLFVGGHGQKKIESRCIVDIQAVQRVEKRKQESENVSSIEDAGW